MNCIGKYIFELTVLEVLTEFNLYTIFTKLKSLKRLHLTLGRKRAGMDFDRSMVGMKLTDVENLGSAFGHLKKLVTKNFDRKKRLT